MDDKVIEILDEICQKHFSGVQTRMAMSMGISQPTLSRILEGYVSDPEKKTKEAINKVISLYAPEFMANQSQQLPSDEQEILTYYREIRDKGHGKEARTMLRFLLHDITPTTTTRAKNNQDK